jgi:hypothetical protein
VELDATAFALERNRVLEVLRVLDPLIDLARNRVPVPDVLGYSLHWSDVIGWPVIREVMHELHQPGRAKVRLPPDLYRELHAIRAGQADIL